MSMHFVTRGTEIVELLILNKEFEILGIVSGSAWIDDFLRKRPEIGSKSRKNEVREAKTMLGWENERFHSKKKKLCRL